MTDGITAQWGDDMNTVNENSQKQKSCLVHAVLILAVPAAIFLMVIVIIAINVLSSLDPFSLGPRERETVFIENANGPSLYMRYGEVNGIRENNGTLERLILATDEADEFSPFYTYLISYKVNDSTKTIVKAKRIHNEFSELNFHLYEAEATPTPNGNYSASPGNLVLSGTDSQNYRWNGMELEINRKWLQAKYGEQRNPGFILEVEGTQRYYFQLQIELGYNYDIPFLVFNAGDEFEGSSAVSDYTVIYSAHPGMKFITDNKLLLVDP